MNKKTENFLDAVCAHIKYKKIHKDIRDEISSHILELKDEYQKKGYDSEKALDMAISAMGDSNEIGKRLNKQHKPKTEWSLIALTAVIAIIGGVVIFMGSNFDSPQSINFQRYLMFALMGVGAMVCLYFLDYTKLKKLSLPIYIISLLTLLFTLFGNNRINGRAFLVIGGIPISSWYAAILFLIAIAGFIEKSRGEGGLSIIKIFDIVTTPHKLNRIFSFITRGKSDPSGGGWQQIMADKWLFASNFFGKATETINGYTIDTGLPGITTNYVLIYLIASLGWVVGIALILVISAHIIRMFVTTRKIKNDFGYYLSLGASTILSAQFAISILIN